MKKLYLECSSGISGDMTVASLIDLGADEKGLLKVLDSLDVDGFKIQISRVKKAGLDCCDFNVVLDDEHENHDHDMEYLHGHEHHHDDHHHHEHEHHHDDHHHHHHEHRGFHDIEAIINHSILTDNAKAIAIKIFRVIAEAEAKAHGESFDKVHFHEVGAVDSIVDVISVAYCIDNLGIDEVVVPELSEGRGTVRCQHGVLPIPVPAVTNIVEAHGIALKIVDIQGELVTPTGAAIVAALRTTEHLPESIKIVKTGLGAGKRAYERPSILRAMLIEEPESKQSYIYRLETNIDDSTGEQLGYVMNKLMTSGARDVHYIPVFMKKNRPAYELVVICDESSVKKMEDIIFTETTTIGIRKSKMERTVLERAKATVSTPYGDVDVKKCVLPDGTSRYYQEYESVTELAARAGMSYPEAVQVVKEAIKNIM